jgi:hypothetical protein
MALTLTLAYFCSSPFWQAFLTNASASFLAIGFGLILVNIYLEKSARKGAVKSLLVLSNRAMVSFHNKWLDLCWAKFGRDEFGKIGQEYIESDGKPEALKQSVRKDIYDLVKNSNDLRSSIENLEESLTELSRMAGWDLDARLLEACLDARISISRFKSIEFDGSEADIDKVTEHIFDIDIHIQNARSLLMDLAGISDED